MNQLFDTSNAKTREEALNIVINKMKNSIDHTPIAFYFDGSGCSCCLSEYFYLIYKNNNNYKMNVYNGYIKHTKTCPIIRCSCNEPFIWKKIQPEEENIDYTNSNFYKNFIGIDNNLWYRDYENYQEQQQENKLINEYNNEEEDTFLVKNYTFYFK